ncbi:MAG: glycosyltransferase family 4 protein [Halothiobacillaceae bacterium]
MTFFTRAGCVFISLVTETFPPDVNGVATTLERLHGALQASGHRCQVVCPRNGSDRGLADGFEVPGISLPFYKEVRLGWPAARRMDVAWREDPPDVVHIATEGPLGWAALNTASRLKLPVSSSLHTNFHAYASHYRAAWLARPVMRYLRNFHNRTGLTFIPTHAQAESLASQGFERLKVLGRGVDGSLFHPDRRDPELRAAWGAAPDQPVILHVGRLAPEKNLELLVSSVQAIREVSPEAVVVIVGDGPRREWLARALPGAIFAGMRRGEDLARHYASADWFVFPSRTETFGNVLMEAMASGLPAICFDYAAGSQLIRHEENGFLVPWQDESAFLAQVQSLSPGSSMPAAAMREAARERAMCFDWRTIQAGFEQSLIELVHGSTSVMEGREQA